VTVIKLCGTGVVGCVVLSIVGHAAERAHAPAATRSTHTVLVKDASSRRAAIAAVVTAGGIVIGEHVQIGALTVAAPRTRFATPYPPLPA
jgi:hypothetical protein